MGFSRQEYWSGLPFHSLGDIHDPGIEPGSPTLWTDALPSEPPEGKINKWTLGRENLSVLVHSDAIIKMPCTG